MDKFYTTDEIAETLKINPQTVMRYIREGKLKALKIGNYKYRVSEKDFQDYLKSLEV